MNDFSTIVLIALAVISAFLGFIFSLFSLAGDTTCFVLGLLFYTVAFIFIRHSIRRLRAKR